MSKKRAHRPATASDVVPIIGPIDDKVTARVIATGATPEEVAEAYAWLSSRDYLRRAAHDTAHGRLASLYHLLDAERQHPQQG